MILNVYYAKMLFLMLCTLFLMPLTSFSQTSWEVSKSEDGICIYTMDKEGSEFKSFKGVALIEAPIFEIIGILKDADNYSNWYGFTKTSKLLKVKQNAQFNYVETNFPWPFRNRDMVYKMSIDSTNPKKIIVNLNGFPDYIADKNGIIRMKKAEGYILLQPLKKSTKVTYVFHSEPGKGIPASLANGSIAELPFKTLLGLRTISEQ